MTNTLHRFGTARSFSDDIIVFALPALGKCGQDEALPVLKRFLEIALEYGPVNMGDARIGGALRATRYKNVFAHWFKRNRIGPKAKSRTCFIKPTRTCLTVRGMRTPRVFTQPATMA